MTAPMSREMATAMMALGEAKAAQRRDAEERMAMPLADLAHERGVMQALRLQDAEWRPMLRQCGRTVAAYDKALTEALKLLGLRPDE